MVVYLSFQYISSFFGIITQQNNIIEESMRGEQLDYGKVTMNERFLSDNMRILKLIRQKMHPLQKSRTSKLLLPRISHRIAKNMDSTGREQKKYIEIQIKDEEDQADPSTQIEEQHRYNIENRRINYRDNSKKRTKNILQTLLKLNRPSALNTALSRQESLSTSNRYTSIPVDEDYQSIDDISLRQEQMLTQEHKNKAYLCKIKHQINDSKKRFLNTIKLSEYIDQRNDKENYSFQYIVNRIQVKEKEKEQKIRKNMPISPFQTISPNKISDYLDMLLPTNKNREKSIQDDNRQKNGSFAELRQRHIKKKTTLVPHDQDTEMEQVSAKLRIKANHKRLIDIKK